MATSSAQGVPTASVDLECLSLMTAHPASADDLRVGSMFNMEELAAGRLFHVHRAEDAFLLSYSTSWKAATPAANAPGTFSAKTVYSRPTFWWVNPSSMGSMMGSTSGYGTTTGQLYPQGDPATLRISSATSINDMVVYLGAHKGGTFLAFYRVNKGNTQLISTQWNVPIQNVANQTVNWDRGVFGFHPSMLMVVGAAANKQLYLMRTQMGVESNQKSAIGGVGQTYLNSKGWQLLPGEAEPLRDINGTFITSEGNVSLINYRNQWLMSTVVDGGTTWNAKFYRALHPSHAWREIPRATVVLGPKATDPMLCGAFFQDLTPNANHAAFDAEASRGAVVYTHTVESATALRTNWGLLQVPAGQM